MARLHRAARVGNSEDVTVCLAEGNDFNAVGILHLTPLMIAAQEGHLAVVQLLLQAGADIHITTPKGSTALHLAAQKGHLKVVQALVAHGADVNARSDGGLTPAISAAQFNRQEVARFLLDQGTDAGYRDQQGRTAADWLEQGGVQGQFKSRFPLGFNSSPAAIKRAEERVRSMMAKEPSAEEFAANHGRNTLVWSYGLYAFEDKEVNRWAKRVSEILLTPGMLDIYEEQYLQGEALEEARKCRAKRAKDAARYARQKAQQEP